MNPSNSNSVLEDAPLLRCEPEYGAIICLQCNNGFPRDPIARHLCERHRISNSLYDPILRSLRSETLARDWENLRRPLDGSAPIEGLKVRGGYACLRCGQKTVNEQIARTHLKCGQLHRVHLQCWNARGASTYWIVTPAPLEPTRPAVIDDPSAFISSSSTGLFPFNGSLFLNDT